MFYNFFIFMDFFHLLLPDISHHQPIKQLIYHFLFLFLLGIRVIFNQALIIHDKQKIQFLNRKELHYFLLDFLQMRKY
jgi:hypothetical protein